MDNNQQSPEIEQEAWYLYKQYKKSALLEHQFFFFLN